MRKLIMWNIMTLDGYFEGEKKWDLPFHELVWGPELEQRSIEQLDQADYLLFGRVTWEGMAAYWIGAEGEVARRMNSVPKLVASNTLTSADWPHSTIISGDIGAEIRRLKSQEGKDIYVFGSADLSDTLIRQDLFDECRIGIAPVVIGKGQPLFQPGTEINKLQLISTWSLENGGVVLTYRPGNPVQS